MSPNFKTINSDRLFYDQWQYCVRFRLDEVSALRNSLDPVHITDVLDQREKWRTRVRERWPHNNFVRGHDAITDRTRENLYAFADFLSLIEEPYKMVISINQCWIYSNSVILLERIGRLPFVHLPRYTESKIVRARNTISLVNPQYRYRSYFRNAKLTTKEKSHLMDFLDVQKDIRKSPGLQQWVDQPFERTQDYFFVDHHSESWITMLSLIRPGLIRKTVQIVAK